MASLTSPLRDRSNRESVNKRLSNADLLELAMSSQKKKRKWDSFEVSSDVTDILSAAISMTPSKFRGTRSPSDQNRKVIEEEESPLFDLGEEEEEEDSFDLEEEEEQEEPLPVSTHARKIARGMEDLIEIVDEELLFRLNYYSASHLKKLRGIGAKRAEYIVKHRKKKPFTHVHELTELEDEDIPAKVVEKIVQDNRCKILLENA